MSTLFIAAVALAAVIGDERTPGGPPTSVGLVEQQPLVPPRTGIELRDAVRAALRRWARPSSKKADLAAREFLVLYGELQTDDQLARAGRQELRTKVRSRLLKLAEQISKRVAVEKRLANSRQPKSVDAAAATGGVLAQFGGFGRPGGFGGRGFGWQGGFGMPGFGGGGFGGPGPGVGMMGGGPFGGPGQNSFDHGQELVELIQRTIAPHTWDVNGGLGSIYYWRPGRAMVIRQTGDVHDQIGGLLEQFGRMRR